MLPSSSWGWMEEAREQVAERPSPHRTRMFKPQELVGTGSWWSEGHLREEWAAGLQKGRGA